MKRSRVALAWFLALFGVLLAAVRMSGPNDLAASEVSRHGKPRPGTGSQASPCGERCWVAVNDPTDLGMDYFWKHVGVMVHSAARQNFVSQLDLVDDTCHPPLAAMPSRNERRRLAAAAQTEALNPGWSCEDYCDGNEAMTPSIVLVILGGSPRRGAPVAAVASSEECECVDYRQHSPGTIVASRQLDDAALIDLVESAYRHDIAIPMMGNRGMPLPPTSVWMDRRPAQEIDVAVAMLPGGKMIASTATVRKPRPNRISAATAARLSGRLVQAAVSQIAGSLKAYRQSAEQASARLARDARRSIRLGARPGQSSNPAVK
jgi:hypothetical protein